MADWRELLRRTKDQVGDPVARWLCEEASGADQLDSVLGDEASARMVAHLDEMVERYGGPVSRWRTCSATGASGTSILPSISGC